MVVFAGIWCLVAIPLDVVAPSIVRVGSIPFGLLNLPVAANVFTGVMLLVVGSALVVRKRAALWFVAVGFQMGWLVVATLVTVLKAWNLGRTPKVLLDTQLEVGLFWAEVTSALVMLVLLWRIRGCFPARIAPGSLRRTVLTLVVGLTISAVVGIGLTELFPGSLRGQRREVVWAVRTAVGLMPDPASPFYGGTGERWLAAVIGGLSTVALLTAGYVLLRSARVTRRVGADDELRIRRLLADHGEADSLGYFATRRDKAALFSPDGRAAISYRVEAGVSLASSDPVGDPASWDAAIAAWLSEAREFGWSPAVMSASERGADVYRRAGLRILAMGDEAIIDVATFRLAGPAMRPVRQAVTRVERAGYRLDVRYHGDVEPSEMAELIECAERWRGGEPERGFSMALGRLGDETDRRCVMVTARDSDGVPRALLSFVPWGRTGLSLDVMRRDPSADNGVVEYMVCGVVDAARRLNVRRISLNFAMFREVFSASERIGAGPVVRATASVLSMASRWWQLESLYRANVKYRPRWKPRFVCFADTLQLNRTLIAAGIAEGFLSGFPVGDGESVRHASPELVAAVDALWDERTVPRVAPVHAAVRGRHLKLDALTASGIAAYPPSVPRSDAIASVRNRHVGLATATSTGEQVSIAGRVVRIRDLGRICFAVVHEAGTEIQVMLTADRTGAELFARWHDMVDVGDQVSFSGEVITTRTAELTVDVVTWTMAAKCLQPLPDQRTQAGPAVGDRRQRHLDLILDPDAMEMLRSRSRLLSTLRDVLTGRGFIEVETPMLHTAHSGRPARPLTTFLESSDVQLYLRVAPERYLKRLCVGGVDRLFELNRNFGVRTATAEVNPELTELGLYQAHADETDMRAIGRDLVLACAVAVHGRPIARRPGGDGALLDVALDGEWSVMSVHDAVGRATASDVRPGMPVADLRELCATHDVTTPFDASAGQLVAALYAALVEPATELPTLYIDFPVDSAPHARPHRGDPRLAEHWRLVAFGITLGAGQSELNDPIVQRARLVGDLHRSRAEQFGRSVVDEDFLTALEFAMPPTGGLCIGVDRLLTMLTGATIDDAVAFPLVSSLPQARDVEALRAD